MKLYLLFQGKSIPLFFTKKSRQIIPQDNIQLAPKQCQNKKDIVFDLVLNNQENKSLRSPNLQKIL